MMRYTLPLEHRFSRRESTFLLIGCPPIASIEVLTTRVNRAYSFI